ncbi:hypothetical protein [Streptomyces profundus]|uniref:hypothetical protein n=1 Tax=Streptomyces profundus TaxID=2867410 RepID=UPI001D168151|nr:hypothetical protein [Streptomyces sp. MA3_2.13]UED85699.1 hypothetical protein K4G22_17090 [Streptomyces sp. MA3_2.13]
MTGSQEEDETEAPEPEAGPAEPDEDGQDDGRAALLRRLREVNARSERDFRMKGGQLW